MKRLIPHARIATSSLSEASRPMAMRIPKSRAIGMVSTRMLGSVYRTSLPTSPGDRPRRMIMSAERKRNRTSMMNV